MFKIVKRQEMAQGTVVLNEIEAPLIAAKARPGQFLILKATEEGERIPLTMAALLVVTGLSLGQAPPGFPGRRDLYLHSLDDRLEFGGILELRPYPTLFRAHVSGDDHRYA